MNQTLFRIRKYLMILCLLLGFYTASAQVKYNDVTFRIDSLANVGLPKSALKEVDKLDSLARKNNNAPQQIRAVIYRMTFQSYLEEDALVAIINRLKIDIDRADYPVKPVLQSLLAQMYWNYYQQNRYRFSQRTKLQQADADFTNWDIQTIISETSRLYALSLQDAAKEQSTPIAVLYGVLEGDSTTRYLRPTLYDLLVQRAFDFFLTDEAAINKPKLPFSLNDPHFFSDSRTFASLEIKTTDTASTEYKGMRYLQQAAAFHLAHKDEEALADLDMQRLKFLYSRSNVEHKDSLYLSALKHIAEGFSAKPISSEALVLEGQYYQGLDSLTIAYSFFKKAVDAWPKSLGGENAAMLIKQIEEKTISVAMEDINVAGKPILALLSYKNLTAAGVEVFQLSAAQLNQFENEFDSSYSNRSQYKLSFLKRLSPVQNETVTWTNLNAFKQHSLEFKIDGLIPGNYVLVAKNASDNNDSLAAFTIFKVSNLAYAARQNPDDQIELRIMDRQTGEPVHGAEIHLNASETKYNSTRKRNDDIDITTDGVSDRNGSFRTNKFASRYNLTISVILGRDTLIDKSKYLYGAQYDPSDDEDPEDRAILFTDRQIYRPGQTIHFKALQLQTLKKEKQNNAWKESRCSIFRCQ